MDFCQPALCKALYRISANNPGPPLMPEKTKSGRQTEVPSPREVAQASGDVLEGVLS